MKRLLIVLFAAGLFTQGGCGEKYNQTVTPKEVGRYEPTFQRDPKMELKEFLAGETGYDGRPSEMIDKDGRKIKTPTVMDVIQAAKKGYNAQGGSTFRTQLYFLAIETQLKLLFSAKPSKYSYVRNFRCSGDFVNQLPDTVWRRIVYNLPENTGKEDPPRITPSGKRFVDIRQPETIEVSTHAENGKFQAITIKFPEKNNKEYYDAVGAIILQFLGWGDFNNDGFEDIAFSISEWNHLTTGGRVYVVGELVLTKREPTGAWQVVKLNGNDRN